MKMKIINYIGKDLFLLSGLLPFMLLLVVPLTFYFSNSNEIDFIFWDVFYLVVISTLLITIFISFTLKYISVSRIAYYTFSFLIVAFSICVWIQSQLLIWDFGPLDGRSINWQIWKNKGYIEIVTWFFSFFIIGMTIIKKEKEFFSLVKIIYIVGFFSVTLAYIDKPLVTKISHGKQKDYDNFFEFHPRQNTIFIVLDTFQSDYFGLINKQYPEETKFLEGFTFYTNTISNFPNTRPSLPAIFSGKIYHNQEPFEEFRSKAFFENDLRHYYLESHYLVHSVGNPAVPPNTIPMKKFLKIYGVNSIHPFFQYIDYSLFRASPIFLKPLIYNEKGWFFSRLMTYIPDPHGLDIKFMNLFTRKAKVNPLMNESGTFKFIHLHTPHPPFLIDESLSYKPNMEGYDGYLSQTRAAVKIVELIIEKIKSIGIYDKSEIVILADHGNWSTTTGLAYEGIKNNGSPNIDPRIQQSALALFLHKPSESQGPMKIDQETPLINSDVSCILKIPSGSKNCGNFLMKIKTGSRVRHFNYYDPQNTWKLEFFSPIREYEISGHPYHEKSWKYTRKIYKKREIVMDELLSRDFSIGETVAFNRNNPPDRYLISGWSYQEDTHRWTDGKEASMAFKLAKTPSFNLQLILKGSSFFDSKKHHGLDVFVKINGHNAGKWTIKDDSAYSVIINKDWIPRSGELLIVFEIKNPSYPKTDDKRLLGIAVREISLFEYNN